MQTQRLIVIFCALVALTNLMAFHVQAAQVTLSWKAPTTNEDGTTLTDLAGYNLYYGQKSRNYDVVIDVGSSTSSIISGLEPGQIYYFAVTAYDWSGNESDFSSEVDVIAPVDMITPSDNILQVTLSPRGDTFINVDSINYSGEPTLNTYTWPDKEIANAVIMKFDLISIPLGSTIHKAILSLALINSDSTEDDTYEITVYKIIHKDPITSRATGYTYDGTNSWTPDGCCYQSIPLAQADISGGYDTQAIDKTREYKSWTITSLVQEWLDNPTENFGLLLNSDPLAFRDRYRYFASMEHPDTKLRPFLSISYTAPMTP
jgi:hypothetical protein